MSQSPVALTVGDLELTADPTPEVDWALVKVEGWYESSELSAPTQRRARSHGSFGQQGWAGGKTISVNGEVRSKDRVLLTDAMEKISATLADGSFGTMAVYDADMGYRWAPVQRIGQPSFEQDEELNVVKFQLQFNAPDAYRYGQTSSASVGFAASSGSGMVFDLFPGGVMDFGPLPDFGIVSVQNPGTAAAAPVFSVSGPSPSGGFTITDVASGRTITYLGVVPDGSVLTLDASTGAVVLDGVADRFGDAVVSAWPVVPAQSSREFLFEPLSSATAAELSVAVLATYW